MAALLTIATRQLTPPAVSLMLSRVKLTVLLTMLFLLTCYANSVLGLVTYPTG
jgi:hypothetical protein